MKYSIHTLSGAVASVLLATCANSHGQLFSDNFDADTSASWNVNATTDATATFLFDYSTMGIPSAPNSVGGSTLGVRFAANITSGAANAVSISPLGQNFTGNYQMTFDMWINANGPFPGGGAGSTEFFTAGVGASGTAVEWSSLSSGGALFAVAGEGGSSRDYRAYKGTSEQFAESGQFAAGTSSASGGAHNASDPYYSGFGSIAAPALQQATFAQQTGEVQPGAPAFAWREVTITRDGDSVSWAIDGLRIATLDAGLSPFNLEGNIFVGYMDIFSSLSDNAELSFGVVDNLVVIVPEPSTVALAILGGVGLLFMARRRK